MAMRSHAAGRCDWTYVGYAGRNDEKRMVTEMPQHLENNIAITVEKRICQF